MKDKEAEGKDEDVQQQLESQARGQFGRTSSQRRYVHLEYLGLRAMDVNPKACRNEINEDRYVGENLSKLTKVHEPLLLTAKAHSQRAIVMDYLGL